eukprot:6546689-Prymnesium_polylepis.1
MPAQREVVQMLEERKRHALADAVEETGPSGLLELHAAVRPHRGGAVGTDQKRHRRQQLTALGEQIDHLAQQQRQRDRQQLGEDEQGEDDREEEHIAGTPRPRGAPKERPGDIWSRLVASRLDVSR